MTGSGAGAPLSPPPSSSPSPLRGDRVRARCANGVTTITLGNGRKRNALTSADWTELERLVRTAGRAEDVRAILVTGRDGTFSSGSDIGEWRDRGAEFVEDSFARMESAFRAIEDCPVPVVAAVEGVAAGAGCQLALACDLRFLARSATIGMPIARLGILATPAFATRLITAAGAAVARQLLYTGELLDAPAAHAAGLANGVCPDPELQARVADVLTGIAAQPAAAVSAAKAAVTTALAPLRTAALNGGAPTVSMDEFRAAVRAFLR